MKFILTTLLFILFSSGLYAQYSKKAVRLYMKDHVPVDWILQPQNKKWNCDMIFKKYMRVDPGLSADYNYEERYDTITLYITLEPVHGGKKREKTERMIKRSERMIDSIIADEKRNSKGTKEDYTKYHGKIASERFFIRIFHRYIHTRRYSFRWNYTWEGASSIETGEIKSETSAIIQTLEDYLNQK